MARNLWRGSRRRDWNQRLLGAISADGRRNGIVNRLGCDAAVGDLEAAIAAAAGEAEAEAVAAKDDIFGSGFFMMMLDSAVG